MKTRYIFAALAATLLLAGCFQDVHELDPSRNVGFVAPELSWANPADAGTDIHDLLVVVNSEEGAYSKHYSNVREFAREPLEVPAGESSILFLANAGEADGYQLSGLPATKFTMAEMFLYYPLLSALMGHNCYMGSAEVMVGKNEFEAPIAPLKPVLPRISLSMSNIPERARVSVVLGNAAASVRLNCGSKAGVEPASESLGNIELGDLDKGDIKTLVPPTVDGASTCDMTLSVTMPDGTKTVQLHAPRMDCGGEYSLSLDYKNLIIKMDVGSFIIENWDVEHSYDGRIYE
jgi:hypothetical protein